MANNNPLCPECKACHTGHLCKHCYVPVCSICCFQHGLEGEYVYKGYFSSKSTSHSADTNPAPPLLPPTSPATVNAPLHTNASAAASVPPTDSPPYLPASESPPTNPPNSSPPSVSPSINDQGTSPRRRKGGSGPIPTSFANTESSRKI
eukprot:10648020-Ditylum_brightwellii.AAC.1